ncbi:MAG: hypothetical protein QOG04_2307 [Actinomycetota bacterium]|jgi:hypothetical protein|nr:hypothetical protein [Actinomycetota bacterium]
MIKRVFWVVVGAVGALQADKWLQQQKDRFRPSALTGTLLDATNRRMEKRRARSAGPRS